MGVAAALSAVRWWLQDSGNLYSQLEKRLYVADPDLGWRLAPGGPPWLGLDAVAALLGLGAAIALAALLLRRRERARGPAVWPRRAVAAAGWLSLAVPLWAFAGGLGPDGAVEALPGGVTSAPRDGVRGALPGLPAGAYQVLQHRGGVVSATLRAGGEVFEARFGGGMRGELRGDPADLTQPLSAWVEVAASSVDTGIDLRNQHAREDLEVERHPALRFELTRLIAARQEGAQAVAFSAAGEVVVMGQRQPVEVSGTLRALDDAGRARLGLAADRPALVAQVSFSLRLDRTPIGDNEGTFTENMVPVAATLLFQKGTERK